jgi:putative membrane protein
VEQKTAGADMNILLGLGKGLTALFLGVVLANLIDPFAQPFALLLNLAGALLVLIHGLELWLFSDRVSGPSRLGLERVQILLFGIFHLQGLSLAPAQPEGEELVQLELEHA